MKLTGYPTFLSETDLGTINDLSMRLLEQVGVDIPVTEARDFFGRRGAQVDGSRVRLPRNLVEESVRLAPSEFVIHARNHEKDVRVGGDSNVFAPGYGAPFLMEAQGARRPTMQDYVELVRVADALPNIDLSGHLLVNPADVRAETAYLPMLLAHMRYSDKPFIGATNGRAGVQASIEMAGILLGGQEQLKERPAMISLINTLSPLAFSAEMVEALMLAAEWRQPLVIAAMVQAGATGTVTLPGVLVQQNAEILAGIALTQLISPGTPVVYGSTSTVMDMNTAAGAIGSPEYPIMVACHAQLARFYGLPSRSGGSLTDSQTVDAQAGIESMQSMIVTVSAGINFVLHACGILGSYLTFSREKMIIDDEICGMVRRYKRGITLTPDELAFDTIAAVGPGGNYLMDDHTLSHFRNAFYRPALASRDALPAWEEKGRLTMTERAQKRFALLLESHVPPALDRAVERKLETYVQSHS